MRVNHRRIARSLRLGSSRAILLSAGGLLALVTTSIGCGSGSPIPLTSVSGNVTLDGTPLSSGNITFMPKGNAGQSASGTIVNGAYELGTFEAGDGAPPGEYTVAVQSYTVEPTMENPKGQPAVPEKYLTTNASGLTATVQESGSQTIDFPLTK